ncbi:CHRD domain-containing protein [Halomarina pelagica]|uniref:CHRD domain-containing protein n=1 Tax=Halomarina pelagica TaxID=2961599 RepID=UPI0020C1CBE2|nr:CHRD domain-containing protein [Halomarina sp. BND7]
MDTSRRTVLKLVGAGTVAGAGLGTQSIGATEGSDDEKEHEKKEHGRKGHAKRGPVFSAGTLTGDEEVPPVETKGKGAAVFQVAKHGGLHIHYALLVANVKDVTQAHIHLGERGENGPVVAFLFGKEDEEGEFVAPLEQGVTENGLLAKGSIRADDLVGPLAGKPLRALIEAMADGGAYVNVHTEEHPAGEVRGQIRAVEEVEVELEEEVCVEADPKLTVEKTVELEVEEDC